MPRNTHWSAAVILLVAACSEARTPNEPAPAILYAVSSGGSDTPVSSQLFGDVTTGGKSIQSDGLGTYQNGTSRVSSILQRVAGDWVLDLTASTRQVRVDFSDALPGNPAAPPFVSALVKPRFIAKASELNAGSFPGMTGLGSTMLSPLAVGQINYGGATYAIRMNSNTHPGTDWVLVTCIAVSNTNACKKWEITPSGSYNGVAKNVGYLEKVGTTSTFIGLYYFTFDIVIAQ